MAKGTDCKEMKVTTVKGESVKGFKEAEFW